MSATGARTSIRLRVLAALVGSALVAGTAVSLPADAATLTAPAVTFLKHATVRGAGAGVIASVRVTCGSGQAVPFLEVTVEQTAPDGTLTGAAGYAMLSGCVNGTQQVLAPMETGAVTENAPFVSGDEPLRPGPARAIAYWSDCNDTTCKDKLYAAQAVVLTDTADLDRLSSTSGRLDGVGTIVARGAAADLVLHTTCAHGTGFVAGDDVLYQRTSSTHVQLAQPFIDSPPPCPHAPGVYRVRMYPLDHVLHSGVAFAQYGAVFGQITLR